MDCLPQLQRGFTPVGTCSHASEPALDARPPVQVTNFTDGTIFNFAWSADGKELFVSRGDITSDVVLINNVK